MWDLKNPKVILYSKYIVCIIILYCLVNIHNMYQSFPFQMKQEVNGLLQVAPTAHFSVTGANLTARVCLVSGD